MPETPALQLEKNKAIVRRIVEEIYNKGDLRLIDELYSADLITHDPVAKTLKRQGARGIQSFKDDVAMIRTALPDVRYTIEEIWAEGNSVVARWSARATHTGQVPGIPATGKQVAITGFTECQFGIDWHIAELYTQSDTLAVMQELGISLN